MECPLGNKTQEFLKVHPFPPITHPILLLLLAPLLFLFLLLELFFSCSLFSLPSPHLVLSPPLSLSLSSPPAGGGRLPGAPPPALEHTSKHFYFLIRSRRGWCRSGDPGRVSDLDLSHYTVRPELCVRRVCFSSSGGPNTELFASLTKCLRFLSRCRMFACVWRDVRCVPPGAASVGSARELSLPEETLRTGCLKQEAVRHC